MKKKTSFIRRFCDVIKNPTKLIISLMLLAFAITAGSGLVAAMMGQPGPLSEHTSVVIPHGASVGKIAYLLEEKGAISSSTMFKVYARFSLLQNHLKAGEYTLEPHVSARTLLRKISMGDVKQWQVTIPEGLTTQEVMDRLAEVENLRGGVVPALEGELLPETYTYTHATTRKDMMHRMKKSMESALKEAWESRPADSLLTTPNELLTLASIVEKETSIESERTTIAGVYTNRLRKGMKLQADPTVIYGASNYDGDLTRAHLREKQPYNTYVNKGLPPGPICNPGRASLMAAANPAQTDALYFVATGDGGHWFAKTHDEHKENVKKYLHVYRAKQHADKAENGS